MPIFLVINPFIFRRGSRHLGFSLLSDITTKITNEAARIYME